MSSKSNCSLLAGCWVSWELYPGIPYTSVLFVLGSLASPVMRPGTFLKRILDSMSLDVCVIVFSTSVSKRVFLVTSDVSLLISCPSLESECSPRCYMECSRSFMLWTVILDMAISSLTSKSQSCFNLLNNCLNSFSSSKISLMKLPWPM